MPARVLRLESERFELRPMGRDSDPHAFQRWTRDPTLMTPLNLPARELTGQQVRDYWAGFDGVSRFFFGIFERGSGAPAGFWMIEGEALHRVGHLHLLLDRPFQKRLVAQETALVLFDFLFDVAGLEKLVTTTLADNAAVVALMRQSRWVREGELRQEVKAADGSGRLDQLRFGLLPREWRAMRADRAAFVAGVLAGRRGASAEVASVRHTISSLSSVHR